MTLLAWHSSRWKWSSCFGQTFVKLWWISERNNLREKECILGSWFQNFPPITGWFRYSQAYENKENHGEKRRYWLHYNQEARRKRGRGSGTSIVQIMVSCDLLTLTKLNPHHVPKRLSGYKQIDGLTHWWDHSSHDPISSLWLCPPVMIQLWNTWTFYAPPNSFSLQNKRKEGNEGYMALYRKGQSKACWDKNEFIRKLEYERI